MAQPRKFSDKNILSAYELVKKGRSWGFAAHSIGMTREGMRKRIKKLGLALTRANPAPLYRLPEITMPTTDIDLAYLAAVVDCEGFIGKLKLHTKYCPYWAIGVANTDKPLIDWLSRIGGGVGVTKERGNHKRKYDWWIRARADVFIFLSCLAPYLRIKQKRAHTAIADYLRWVSKCEGRNITEDEARARMTELLAYVERSIRRQTGNETGGRMKDEKQRGATTTTNAPGRNTAGRATCLRQRLSSANQECQNGDTSWPSNEKAQPRESSRVG